MDKKTKIIFVIAILILIGSLLVNVVLLLNAKKEAASQKEANLEITVMKKTLKTISNDLPKFSTEEATEQNKELLKKWTELVKKNTPEN